MTRRSFFPPLLALPVVGWTALDTKSESVPQPPNFSGLAVGRSGRKPYFYGEHEKAHEFGQWRGVTEVIGPDGPGLFFVTVWGKRYAMVASDAKTAVWAVYCYRPLTPEEAVKAQERGYWLEP